MRFIPTRVHSVLDYTMAALLLLLPLLLGFGKTAPETGVLVLMGGATIAYSLTTGYEGGIVKLLSMPAHLIIDFIASLFIACSPWIFGFSDRVYTPFVILGIIGVIISLVSKTTPAGIPAEGKEHVATVRGLSNDMFKPERLEGNKENIAEGA